KADRKAICHKRSLGYSLQTALLISDRDGTPISPLSFSLWANDGLYTTRQSPVLAVRKGVALRLDLNEDIAFCGDEVLLRRLIMNLLDNAIKYTPSGGSVSVKLANEQTAIKIIVSDTGMGIPAEAAAHVFERFYRADKARSRADGGSGLGLAIARWVAETHKGSIDLVSISGKGSKFIVSLPK
ncbi:MAG: ATP-binding protein, partial [Blastocatellia bacterium]